MFCMCARRYCSRCLLDPLLLLLFLAISLSGCVSCVWIEFFDLYVFVPLACRHLIRLHVCRTHTHVWYAYTVNISFDRRTVMVWRSAKWCRAYDVLSQALINIYKCLLDRLVYQIHFHRSSTISIPTGSTWIRTIVIRLEMEGQLESERFSLHQVLNRYRKLYIEAEATSCAIIKDARNNCYCLLNEVTDSLHWVGSWRQVDKDLCDFHHLRVSAVETYAHRPETGAVDMATYDDIKREKRLDEGCCTPAFDKTRHQMIIE